MKVPFLARQTTPLLAIDIGTVNTRAMLFDAVEGRYRFLAAGIAPTTANPPMSDANEGIYVALDMLANIAGRRMVSQDKQLLIPSTADGSGADHLAISMSSGTPLKAVVVGLLDRVSLASALNLADTCYTNVIETFSLNDGRKVEEQIDNLLHLTPDVIIIAGGTDEGATRSVLKLVNALGMALYLMPEANRPHVLYAGNPQLADQVNAFFSPLTSLSIAPNVRPSLAVEQLGPAQSQLNEIFAKVQAQQTIGIHDLNVISGGYLVPTAHAIGRVAKFFSQIIPNPKQRGVLAVDIGASATAVAAAFNGDVRLKIFNKLGIGSGLISILESSRLEDIFQWIPFDIPPAYVVDYIQNKTIYPDTLPATREDMAIEQALAREIIRRSMQEMESRFPKNAKRVEPGLLPVFDPILVSGSVIANAPTTAQALLMILDALQPVGIQQIILDKNSMVAAMGAAIPVNPALVSQLLLDPISLLNLGFVISPICKAKPGSPVLRVRIVYDTGHENVLTVHQGTIQKIPLPHGQRARLYIDPLQRANVGSGPGRSVPGKQVVGGPFGVIIDARGRPLQMPDSPEKRRAAMQRWLLTLEKER